MSLSDDVKLCAFCMNEKDLVEFHRNCNAKDGRQGYCKECCKVYSKSRRSGTRRLQSGAAYQSALEDIRCQNIRSLEDMMKAMRRPKVMRMLKQIRMSDVFEDLRKIVPAHAMVPLGFDFSDYQ